MIVASSSETELDFANYRVGISSATLVNRFIVRVVSVTVRIIAIGIVRERVPKIAKEEEPIVEVPMAEPIAAKATTTKTTTVKATAKAATKAADAEAATAEPAVTAATTTAARHHV